jgi:hypothetical protein
VDDTLQITIAHLLVFTSLLVTAFNTGHSPSCGFQNCPHASATAAVDWLNGCQLPNSKTQLNSRLNSTQCNSQQQLLDYLTNQLSRFVLVITSRHWPHRKHCFSLLCPLVAIETFLFVKPLLSNSRHIFVSQLLPSTGCMSQYCMLWVPWCILVNLDTWYLFWYFSYHGYGSFFLICSKSRVFMGVCSFGNILFSTDLREKYLE